VRRFASEGGAKEGRRRASNLLARGGEGGEGSCPQGRLLRLAGGVARSREGKESDFCDTGKRWASAGELPFFAEGGKGEKGLSKLPGSLEEKRKRVRGRPYPEKNHFPFAECGGKEEKKGRLYETGDLPPERKRRKKHEKVGTRIFRMKEERALWVNSGGKKGGTALKRERE